MNYYNLIKDEAFGKLDIPAPEKLETTADFSQLTQHMVSVFTTALNLYYAQHGYEARQQLLAMIVLFLTEILPIKYPSLVKNYPASIDKIYPLVGELITTEEDTNGAKAG